MHSHSYRAHFCTKNATCCSWTSKLSSWCIKAISGSIIQIQSSDDVSLIFRHGKLVQKKDFAKRHGSLPCTIDQTETNMLFDRNSWFRINQSFLLVLIRLGSVDRFDEAILVEKFIRCPNDFVSVCMMACCFEERNHK